MTSQLRCARKKCSRAKLFYAPARRLANQSELRRHEQLRFQSKEPFDLIFMDMKIVTKGSKGKVHEASLNLLEAWTGTTRTYRLLKHDANAIRNCLTHFVGK